MATFREPLLRIIIDGERCCFVPGDVITGKVLFHTLQPRDIVSVKVALEGVTKTARLIGQRSVQDLSTESFTSASKTLFTSAAYHRTDHSQSGRNTKAWDFSLDVPSHVNPLMRMKSVTKLDWPRNDTFMHPNGVIAMPPTVYGYFRTTAPDQCKIFIEIHHHLEALVEYHESGTTSSREAVAQAIVVIRSSETLSHVVPTIVPMLMKNNTLAERLRLAVGHTSKGTAHKIYELRIERWDALAPHITIVFEEDSVTSDTTFPQQLMLCKALVEFTETIHARTMCNKLAVADNGQRVYGMSHSSSFSKAIMNAVVPQDVHEGGLDLETSMGVNFADAIASFLPTMSTVNVKISHSIKISLEFMLRGQRYEVQLEQSFKVVRKRFKRPDAPILSPTTATHARQDSAFDGILCGDDLRHPIASPKGKQIDLVDADGAYRKDWASW